MSSDFKNDLTEFTKSLKQRDPELQPWQREMFQRFHETEGTVYIPDEGQRLGEPYFGIDLAKERDHGIIIVGVDHDPVEFCRAWAGFKLIVNDRTYNELIKMGVDSKGIIRDLPIPIECPQEYKKESKPKKQVSDFIQSKMKREKWQK